MVGFPADVTSLLQELSALPYENLSKIVAFHQGGNRESTLGLAIDWLEETKKSGVGGTCFSLTWWLAQRIRALGLECVFLMGDRSDAVTDRARNIHCGLRFEWQGRAYLLDPGYMIFDPLLLPEAGLMTSVWISPNEVAVQDLPARGAWRLWSGRKPRFDFRKKPVSEAEFLTHWEASYELPMMHYPVLNRVENGVQYYLQKRSLLVRAPGDALEATGTMRKLSQGEMMETFRVTFKIPEALAREALDIVLRAAPDFFRR